MKLSNSGMNKYQTCPWSYKLHYIDGIRPVTFSSSLTFGAAIDEALNFMLENKDSKTVLKETRKVFDRAFEQGKDSLGNIVYMPLNPNIEYSRSDFDSDLLEKSDWRELFCYDKNFFDTKKEVEDSLKDSELDDGTIVKGKKWLDIPEEKRSVINYATWKCLSKKGHLFIEAYHSQILPKIIETIKVQWSVDLTDQNGDALTGILDAVVRVKGSEFGLDYDPVIILDNKTSTYKYELDSVVNSGQLSKYKATLNILANDPNYEWNTHIDYCGYAVLIKKLIKDKSKVCKDCGHVGTGSHKTCDNVINDKRCGGEWEKSCKFDVATQFLVDFIPDTKLYDALESAELVKKSIEYKLFPKNQQQCHNQFGKPCVYLGLCTNGDMHGLVTKERTSENK